LENHYDYVLDSITNTYNFSTRNNILYKVAFLVDETFSTISGEDIPNIFQIVVEKASDSLEPFDPKVSKTIESIVERFFRKTENSLIYVCSDEKDNAKSRYRVFDRWYENSKYKDEIVKIDKVIGFKNSSLGTYKLYTSFMFHKKNRNFEKLIEIYNQIEKVLIEDK
jgi:hypothetical protein